ncbi:DICT sensory domain-containing protein [Natronomonas sp. EA1]|uniref:DICT sensory domain-containing protein n=1 Tax=Natronomonas sp. EA1 TaxID=3421655 RepID=UPI003EB7C1A2
MRVDSLLSFIRTADRPERTLALVNRTVPRPFQTLLEETFEDQGIVVREAAVPDEAADVLYLLDGDDLVATSPLSTLQETVLLVNSDLYITSTRGFDDLELPAVIEELAETRFSLRGYPESNKEKLLLIVLSRCIERLALDGDGGTLRASFQRLSRLRDELGTREVYERLGETNTDVHVYGVPDRSPAIDALSVHGGESTEYRDSWFVVYAPASPEAEHAALVAIETAPREWDAVWTFDPETVRAVDAYIAATL